MRIILNRVWRIWLSIVGIVLVTAILLGTIGWWVIQPVQPSQVTTQAFVVPKGQSIRLIGRRLQEAGLIRQQIVFPLVVKWLKLESKLQAGTFQLSPSWAMPQIVHELTKGTNDIWITIPEGWRREEIADYLSRQELAAFDKEQFLIQTAGQEGQLFPDTYLVPKQITAEGLVAILTVTFDKKIVQGLATELEQSDLTLKQALTFASLIEREAGDNTQMPLVAGVLNNRLKRSMPLQVDATLQYAKGYSEAEKSWWTTPLAADRQLNSPFNTYMHPGLPPAPIANPGVAAVTAALQPMPSDYLYYIHDTQGKLHLAKTLDEHNANVQKYLR
jgi:UPF0755 protein